MKKNMKKIIYEKLQDVLNENQNAVGINQVKGWTTVNVDFYNENADCYDEVQFDIENLRTSEGIKELAELLAMFCEENGINIATTHILTVSCVRDASSYEEMMELEAEEEGYCFKEE